MALDAMSDQEKSIQREINDSHSNDAQDAYPIIVRRNENGSVQAWDGNRRSLRAGLYDRETIEAYVIQGDSANPINYWVPVNDLMNISKLYQLSRTDHEKQAVRDSLEILFQCSVIARINYETRLLKQSNPWAEKLYNHKPTI